MSIRNLNKQYKQTNINHFLPQVQQEYFRLGNRKVYKERTPGDYYQTNLDKYIDQGKHELPKVLESDTLDTKPQKQIKKDSNKTFSQDSIRKLKGLQIARTTRITQTKDGWKVPRQSGGGYYIVRSNGYETTCTCPDHELRHCKCKHIFAVEFIITGEVNNDGTVTITRTIRKTYPQNWKAYDRATINQKTIFMRLLNDLTNNFQQPEYKFGRPSLPLGDMLYSSVMKIFTTFSLRRFMGDMQIAWEKEYVDSTPCYASVGHFLQREDITPILARMVTITSLPLVSVENDFAADSTGFGTTVFQRWFSFKYGKEINSKRWVKCHFITGVKTNIITNVKITSEFDNDCPQLPELVNKTAEHFDMNEVSCDKMYLSRDNLELVDSYNATAFIPFKSNSKASSNGRIWKKMYYLFMLKNEEFLQHYHKRSNAESTVQMIKSKFGDFVRSKTWTAQVNEVLCKIICHNICVNIQEMHELGIEPNFCAGGITKI